MREAFIEHNFSAKSHGLIDQADSLIGEYQQQGYKLTLRQLYYQFVARDLLPNTLRSYKRLGEVVSKARLAGLLDWSAIEDRTRNRKVNPSWNSPAELLRICSESFRYDTWKTQPIRVEVWIEKEALVGVIAGICEELDVPYFPCRGYVSQSEQWSAGKRFSGYFEAGQDVVILHLGDHDPSGLDMTRDNQERLDLFSGGLRYEGAVDVRRIALNMDQVQHYRPPPNPAKMTDSRFAGYIRRYGSESWELDALEPRVLSDLIRGHVLDCRDPDRWETAIERQEEARERLRWLAEDWRED